MAAFSRHLFQAPSAVGRGLRQAIATTCPTFDARPASPLRTALKALTLLAPLRHCRLSATLPADNACGVASVWGVSGGRYAPI